MLAAWGLKLVACTLKIYKAFEPTLLEACGLWLEA
jgi:hypothetical protein